MAHDAVIVDAIRTASGKGKPGGALSGVHPVDLLAAVLRELVRRNGLDPAQVEDVIGGCVTQAGEQSLNVTRNAVLAAGFPETVPATTVDRQCGSSQQAAAFAAQGVMAGCYDIVIAAGLLTTLVTTLEHTGGRFGLQTMCEGGGMANATIIERLTGAT